MYISWQVGSLKAHSQVWFLAIEIPLKMVKNAFYFMLKPFFVLEIFTFLDWLFGYVKKGFDKKAMVNFKINDVTVWINNNYNMHITRYLKKQR